MECAGQIAIIGGASRLAAALIAGPLAAAVPVSRGTQRGANGIAAPSWDMVTPDHLGGFETVINCTGLVRGSVQDLNKANVALPVLLAKAARAAGARRFVHVSSFSVHGAAPIIGPQAPERPTTPYGRSKLAGDRALQALVAPDFAVISLRLPSLVGAAQDSGKLNRLLRCWRKVRLLPCPHPPVRRSMITYALAAEVIALAARRDKSGIVYAADPTAFSFADAAEAIRKAGGPNLRTLPLPRPMLAAARLLSPRIHDSLWRDSVLCEEANLAAGLPSQLYATIAKFARGAAV